MDRYREVMASFDPTRIDLTEFDVTQLASQANQRAADLAKGATGRATDLARDAAYVTVGLGILTFQRAQVRRRELERALRR